MNNEYLVKYSQSIDQNVLREIKKKIAEQNTMKKLWRHLNKKRRKTNNMAITYAKFDVQYFFPIQ